MGKITAQSTKTGHMVQQSFLYRSVCCPQKGVSYSFLLVVVM